MNCVIIIPTLNPTEKLIKLINELKSLELNNIVIINDGSTSNCMNIFNELKKLNCKVIDHDKNYGKGIALKTGIKFAYQNFKNISGYVTADGDFQHLPKDIFKVAFELERNPQKIILGVRNFMDKNVPFKSKIGNKFSSLFFKIQTGIELNDTQTGLRGIPIKYTDLVLETNGERYDYEMNFLINVSNKKIEFFKVNIETVYENKNKLSHFKPVRDSILIYKELVKYSLNSLLSAIIDVSLFTILINVFSITVAIEVACCNVFARIVSGMFNFTVNRNLAFKSVGDVKKQAYMYSWLFVIQMIISTFIISLLSKLPINITIMKIVVDFIIFFINYVIQKRFIFKSFNIMVD